MKNTTYSLIFLAGVAALCSFAFNNIKKNTTEHQTKAIFAASNDL